MIICGFSGIGKSYVAEHFPNVVDLEPKVFEPLIDDLCSYVDYAVRCSNLGKFVLVSFDIGLRQRLMKEVPFFTQLMTVVPDSGDKDWYMQKYRQMGYSDNLIQSIMDNWDMWLDKNQNMLPGENWQVLKPHETLREAIVRLSQESANSLCDYNLINKIII